MKESKTLDVFYKGRLVGKLAEMADRRIAFQYSNEWLEDGFSISPMSLPLRNDVFVPSEISRERFGGLFGVFADSLPDSWGQLLLNRYLDSVGIGREEVSTLDRLAYVGRSGMGALEYFPSKETRANFNTGKLDFDKIAEECDNILSSKTSDRLDVLYKMGGSSGGTRPKILLSEGQKEWIVKFPSKDDPAIGGVREYDYSLCAKKCGIVMTETALTPSFVCGGYFKTERFDRIGKDKVFSVSFAGLLETDFRVPSCDYETYFRLVQVLTKDNSFDKEQLFRVMCFNVAAHNLDDHTKNFSFTYTNENGWRLAPAYDLTYSNTYWGEHTTSVNGKGKDITREDLIKIGAEAALSKGLCEKCIDEIEDGIKDLDKYLKSSSTRKRKKLPFEDRISDFQNS